MRKTIESQLATKLNGTLVRELLDAHEEAKRNFYLGGLRLSEVEGGRFCEAAFRILEQITTGKWTPLGKQLNTEKVIDQLRTLDGSKFVDSVRLHVPRALRLVYDIRNKRDAAHLADGIDPSLQDATVVISTVNWGLVKLVRMSNGVSPAEAHRILVAM